MPTNRLRPYLTSAQARDRLALHTPFRTFLGRLRCSWCGGKWKGGRERGGCTEANRLLAVIVAEEHEAVKRARAHRRLVSETREAHAAHLAAVEERRAEEHPQPLPVLYLSGRHALDPDTLQLPVLAGARG